MARGTATWFLSLDDAPVRARSLCLRPPQHPPGAALGLTGDFPKGTSGGKGRVPPAALASQQPTLTAQDSVPFFLDLSRKPGAWGWLSLADEEGFEGKAMEERRGDES